MSCGWAKASACCLQTTLSCAFLCHIVSLQYLSRLSLHRLAGLPCRLFLSVVFSCLSNLILIPYVKLTRALLYGAGPAWRIPVWRVPVRRRSGVALFQFGAFQYGAGPVRRISLWRSFGVALRSIVLNVPCRV